MGEERERRAGRNEALFREVNERISEMNESEFPAGETSDFLCECVDSACTVAVALTAEEYRWIRSVPTRFFVVPGHAWGEVEDVIEDFGRYQIVAKQGKAEDVAIATDPRT
jgi:hypothetical protein